MIVLIIASKPFVRQEFLLKRNVCYLTSLLYHVFVFISYYFVIFFHIINFNSHSKTNIVLLSYYCLSFMIVFEKVYTSAVTTLVDKHRL